MNWQNVTKWCCAFSSGKTNVHEEGRPFVISNALLQRTEEAIWANRHLTIKNFCKIISEVPMRTLYEAVAVILGYYKLCAIQNKCRDMLTSGICLLHDNTHPHAVF